MLPDELIKSLNDTVSKINESEVNIDVSDKLIPIAALYAAVADIGTYLDHKEEDKEPDRLIKNEYANLYFLAYNILYRLAIGDMRLVENPLISASIVSASNIRSNRALYYNLIKAISMQ